MTPDQIYQQNQTAGIGYYTAQSPTNVGFANDSAYQNTNTNLANLLQAQNTAFLDYARGGYTGDLSSYNTATQNYKNALSALTPEQRQGLNLQYSPYASGFDSSGYKLSGMGAYDINKFLGGATPTPVSATSASAAQNTIAPMLGSNTAYNNPQPTTTPTQQTVNPYQESNNAYLSQIEATNPQLAGQIRQMLGQSGQELQNNPYVQGLLKATASGAPAPQNATGGMTGTQQYMPQTPQANMAMGLMQTDPFLQGIQQQLSQWFSQQNQQQTLVKQYQDLVKSSGLEGINAELLNMKKVIEGTEDDLRTEITKAGGFATESQVQALTMARNKTLIQNYNNLLAAQQSKQQYIDTLMNLSAQDKQNANQQFNQMMNYEFQIADYGMKMQQNAVDQYNNIVKNVGYDGLFQMLGGDKYSQSLVEKSLGIAPGGLASLAQQAQQQRQIEMQKSQLDAKLTEAQIANQYSQIADRNRTISTNVSLNKNSSYFSPIIQGAAGLVPATKKSIVQSNISSAINNNDWGTAFAEISNAVSDGLTGSNKTKFDDSRTDLEVMRGLKSAVEQFAAAGGDMGLLTGTEEQIKRKLGIDSGKATQLAVNLWRNFQDYRLNMTGAAFSPDESRDYASVNPTLGKSLNLNLSVIQGAMDALENRVISTVKTRIPMAEDVYGLMTGKYQLGPDGKVYEITGRQSGATGSW